MKTLLVKNGRVVDPASGFDGIADILVEGDRITSIKQGIDVSADEIVDARGLIVCPGFIDMHTHLREPGREDEETIYTGTRAAAAGGFTSVCPMPNTMPPIDSTTGINHIKSVSAQDAVVNVFPIAAITKGQEGKSIVEFGDLVNHGAVAFSDDGHPVMNSEIMHRALEYTAMFDVPILEHCEDKNLSADGVIHEGRASIFTGLRGIPSSAESSMVARNVILAEETGGRLHICHISTKESVDEVRRAQKRGVKVTAEVTPHHIALTEDAVLDFNTNAKINPPLRSKKDRQALIEALADGTIGAIATDHAPHTENEKQQVFNDAPFGAVGLETAFAVAYTHLVKPSHISLNRLIEALTVAPARILHLDRGTLKEGAIADITIVDLNREHKITKDFFASKSKNSPFIGCRLTAFPSYTIVSGSVIFKRD